MNKKHYQISDKEIHKSVRLIGSAIRRVSPDYSEEIFYKQNELLDRFLKGHWFSVRTWMKEYYVTRKDGSKLRIVVTFSRKKRTKAPVTGLLWMHGGGYAIGLPEQDFIFTDQFCKDGSCVAVLPDYRRGTEAPYPAALEDCYLALKWLWHYADKLGIDRRQIFVGGDSAGGGLAAAVCLYARDKGEIPIAFHMPVYPMLDDRECTKSSQENDAPVWNTQANRVAWNLYLKDVGEEIPYYGAPARAEDLKGMPPCCTYIGTIEPFHDETVAYCEMLAKEGIPVHLKVFEGCFHAFDLMGYPTKLGKEAREFLQSTFKYAQKHYYCDETLKQQKKGDMMLHKLQPEEYDKVYDIMVKSFPKTERRPYEAQVALLDEPLYQIYVLKDEDADQIQGFMAVWEFEKYTFLEHFAVNPDCRNGGFGSVMLKELMKISPNPICLEVELPDEEMAVRRIGFYERNGFFFNDYPYMQPAFFEDCEEIPLRIMTSGAPVEEEGFHEIAELIYREAYHREYDRDWFNK